MCKTALQEPLVFWNVAEGEQEGSGHAKLSGKDYTQLLAMCLIRGLQPCCFTKSPPS